jgi:hypothetical protein
VRATAYLRSILDDTRYETNPEKTYFDRYLLNWIGCWREYVARIASGISQPTLVRRSETFGRCVV